MDLPCHTCTPASTSTSWSSLRAYTHTWSIPFTLHIHIWSSLARKPNSWLDHVHQKCQPTPVGRRVSLVPIARPMTKTMAQMRMARTPIRAPKLSMFSCKRMCGQNQSGDGQEMKPRGESARSTTRLEFGRKSVRSNSSFFYDRDLRHTIKGSEVVTPPQEDPLLLKIRFCICLHTSTSSTNHPLDSTSAGVGMVDPSKSSLAAENVMEHLGATRLKSAARLWCSVVLPGKLRLGLAIPEFPWKVISCHITTT